MQVKKYLRAGWNKLTAVSIESLSGRESSTYTVVNVVMVEFRIGAIVLIEKLVFNVAYEKTCTAGFHFGNHGHTIDLFIIIVHGWKTVQPGETCKTLRFCMVSLEKDNKNAWCSMHTINSHWFCNVLFSFWQCAFVLDCFPCLLFPSSGVLFHSGLEKMLETS